MVPHKVKDACCSPQQPVSLHSEGRRYSTHGEVSRPWDQQRHTFSLMFPQTVCASLCTVRAVLSELSSAVFCEGESRALHPGEFITPLRSAMPLRTLSCPNQACV